MNIFEPFISGSLTVSGSGFISGDLTVGGTINATISGTTSNALNAQKLNNQPASYYAITGSNTFTADQTVTGSIYVQGNVIINGTSYNAATSGSSGTAGTSGSSGSSGTSGSSGSSGTSGTSGSSGSDGSSGTSGSSGSSGTSGTSITTSGSNNVMTKFTSTTTVGNSALTDNGVTLSYMGALGIGTSSPITPGLIRATNDVIAYYGSDERLKENIETISDSLDKLTQIRGVEFDWKEMPGIHENIGHDIGVIAQEIQAVLPEIVTMRDNGFLAVKYEKIVALLIESNKELLKRVEALESKIK